MPTYQFEAMDATGQEIRDVIDAASEEEAQTTIRQMGYFVTKISVKKSGEAAGRKAGGTRKKSFAIGGGGAKHLTLFTRQLAILQDAGLPILRSLKILEGNAKPGRLKNALIDVCDEIEGGATLSEALAKSPRIFNRLYVNMIKAGEAGGALEIILQRLAEFMERAQSLKRKVQGAMIYPIVVVLVAIGILTFIMIKIVPVFKDLFEDFEVKLPAPTLLLIAMSDYAVTYWFLLILIPACFIIFVMMIRKFKHGRMGFDMYLMRLPVLGQLVTKNILARTTRTLGTLISSGVPILEALNITRETSGNAVFERMFGKVTESIREGEVIAKPLKEYSVLGFHPLASFFWALMAMFPGIMVISVAMTAELERKDKALLFQVALLLTGVPAVLAVLWSLTQLRARVVDDLVVNMVDVGEETGELDTMLYKVADYFDEEVKVLTEALTKLMEPMLIVFLGVAVGFIVVSLFLPLVELINNLS